MCPVLTKFILLQNGHFKNLSNDIMAISDRTERLPKLEEVMAKLKIIYKQGSSIESSVTKVTRPD